MAEKTEKKVETLDFEPEAAVKEKPQKVEEQVEEKKKRKKKEKIVVVRGKRKEAIARAYVKKGKGIVRVNDMALSTLPQRYLRAFMEEPLQLAGDAAQGLDIIVNVHGGGAMGQAEAVRQAIARGIVEFTGDDALKQKFVDVDRNMLIEDYRRVEPKKYKGPKARARFQKSYR